MTDRIEPTERESAIVDAFVHLSDTLVDDYDVIDFLHYLTRTCVELGGADEAAVMLASPSGRLQAVASSTERTRLLELFELQNHEGPCLDAFQTATVVASDDLRTERRWPTFVAEATAVGFAAVHSVPLRLRRETIGALNLLRVQAGAVTERDARLMGALADIATVGVLQERTITRHATEASGLQHALTSRVRIEQAKGIVAERAKVTIDEAFDLLRSYARAHQQGLTDIATGVVNRRIDLTGGGRALIDGDGERSPG
jgi:GAF domain-containing protein